MAEPKPSEKSDGMARNPNDDTEPHVQRLVIGSYRETGMGPQGLASVGLSVSAQRQLTSWYLCFPINSIKNMLYQLLNRRVKNRITGKSNLYSVSFSNAKLIWRHAKIAKKLYGKQYDMLFTISHVEEGARSDTILGFWVKKADENDKAFSDINKQISSGLDEESKQIIKDIISKRFGDFIGKKELVFNKDNVTFFENKFVCVRFEEVVQEKLASDLKKTVCYIFCNSFDLEVDLFVFSENKEEMANIMEDFEAIVSSIKISDDQ